MQEIESISEQIESLSKVLYEKLFSYWKPVSVLKGEYVFQNGENHFYMNTIRKGAVRIFYRKDHKEVNMWFGFEGDIVFSLAGYSSRNPALENIIAMEDCELERIHIDQLQALIKEDNQLSKLMLELTEKYFFLLEVRMYHQLLSSASERYEILRRYFPQVLNRIPLGQIASYLGINQVSLSRIRANISNKK